jgi:hypothetical protein
MAKLSDPSSVARPSEVEGFKKGLVSAGLGTRNKTAKDLLANFESEVNTRADNAYEIRGLSDLLKSRKKEIPEEKFVNGVKYKKVQGGWAPIEQGIAR